MSSSKSLRQRFRDFWSALHYGQRRRLIWSLALVLLLLAGGLAYLAFQPAINRWRHKQALEQATHFAEEKNYREMLLALQRASQIAPGDVDTWRRIAEALESLGRSDAIVARENIVILTPEDPEARLRLATEAMRFEQPLVAQEALKPLEGSNVKKADFHRISAELARALGDNTNFEQHIKALCALEPDNQEAQLKLAAIQLHGTNSALRAEALTKLEALAAAPKVQLRAALLLLEHAAELRSNERANTVVRLLLERLPGKITGAVAPSSWNQLLNGLKTAAAQGSEGDVVLLVRWLGRIRRAPEAMEWINSLPEARRQTPNVRAALAEIAAKTGDLDQLRSLLEAGVWGPIPHDTITLALAAHLQFLASAETRSRETWNDAIASVNTSPVALTTLARLAQLWGEPIPAEAALRALVTVQPKTLWAYGALRESYQKRGDSVRLLSLYETWQENAPEPIPYVNAWIRLGCVLDRLSSKMDERLGALTASNPPASLWVSQAALLWRKKKTREALNILRLLPESERKTPEASYWLCVVQCDLGNRDAATAAALNLPKPESFSDEEVSLLVGLAAKSKAQLPAAWKNYSVRRAPTDTPDGR